ncbi:MAG: hypothetical protein ACRDTG_20155 [Pseudonocardiaceae bacterium]
MTGRALSGVLEAACDVMTDLAIFPLAFEADARGAHLLTVMNSRALRTRSRGPYSPDNLPPEALATAESISYACRSGRNPSSSPWREVDTGHGSWWSCRPTG